MIINIKQGTVGAVDAVNLEVIRLEECDSTNDYLKQNYEQLKGKFPVLVVSDLQTAGRGRASRVWISNKGQGIYASFGFFLKNKYGLNLLPLVSGISVIKTLQHLGNIKNIPGNNWGLKWPNDVVYKGKKIAGILIENEIMETHLFCITGIGINLNYVKDDFPGELAKKAMSLKMITGVESDYSVSEIIPILADFFFQWLAKLENDEKEKIIETANQYSQFLLDKPISFHLADLVIKGIFKGINHDGGLILEKYNGDTTIYYIGELFL
ncbi:MAG: biotin--[acetyl-CoA-carboxylase] ligase [Acidobacteria bacterium]|jgi:BirA family biotin operon repressor/biotin-[acetyl-CoA-carboxylase] ligase|nr:biotin--[acetyl-CoA-carboxylase] ligase [Acidobacteriota bacterium]